jgi:hypothetical protein
VSKDEHFVRREELPFVRSFVCSFGRSFIRLLLWNKENDNVRQKSNDEGKKEQNKGRADKKVLVDKSGFETQSVQITQCAKSSP